MIIHGIAIETIGIHWWLHEKSIILSVVLLVLNIYSVIFFLADMQAIRLNPVYVTNDTLYLSLGLMKRTEIRFDHIAEIIEDKEQLKGNYQKIR